MTATPDGELVRETTLAALSDDPRRYAPLTPTVQLVALAVLVVALVAWFVLAP